jgi:hypothetical protein
MGDRLYNHVVTVTLTRNSNTNSQGIFPLVLCSSRNCMIWPCLRWSNQNLMMYSPTSSLGFEPRLVQITPRREEVTFWWDDDNVFFVLDQHAEWCFYGSSSLTHQSAGRHIAPAPARWFLSWFGVNQGQSRSSDTSYSMVLLLRYRFCKILKIC